jgi:hypothetical protein
MNTHTYHHVCKNNVWQSGSREDCQRCNPKAPKDNTVIVKQAQQIAELKAALNEWVTKGAYLGGDVQSKKELLQRSRELLGQAQPAEEAQS